MNTHENWMRRCLELALLGAGKVAPNPMVGSVIVADNKIIGEGWHQAIGGSHAEVHAINSVKDKSLLTNATLYVNLEPCSHFGKTPPCANLILENKISKVVIGMSDPNALVAGKGIQKLRDAGVEVTVGILELDCKRLNRRFSIFMLEKRPFIILKWAQSRNGFLSPDASKISKEQFEVQRHITGKLVQKLVHKWRTKEDAIMVGTNTALTDDPALNNRAWEGRAPTRIVLDQHLRLPVNLKLLDQTQKSFIINGIKNFDDENNIFIKLDFSSDWFKEMLQKLFEHNIQSVVVEGGAILLNNIIDKKYWDEAIVFYSPVNITDGIKAPYLSGKIVMQDNIGNIQMTQFYKE